jgi:hypothetical protein
MSENIIGASAELSMQIIVSEKDSSVYVKLEGFEDLDDAEQYAEYLNKNLPLLLFETTIIQ